VLVISGCTSLIISVAFSPDGRLVSTGTNDGSIGLWEVGSERQICFQYPGENAERPFSFSFCADGRSVVSSSKNAIKIWSVKKWFHYATQEKGSDEIARSSDRKVGTVKVFDMTPYSRTLNRHRFYEDDPGRPLIELEGYRSAIRDGEYIFSPDRARLLIRGGGQPPGLDLWDVSKERKLGRIPYNFTDTILFTFSQDGRFIYIVENFRLPWVWDALDGREICSFSGGRKSSCDYATLSPDGRAIATSGRRSFEISLISKMAIPIELNGHEKDRKSLSYLPDGRSIVLVSESRTVLVLDIQRNSVIMRFPAMDYWFGNVEYDVINNYLLVKHSEGQDVLVLEPMPGVSDYPIITPLRLYLFRECRWDSHITACCLRCGKRFVVPKDKIAAIRSFEKQCHLSKSQIPCLSLSPQAWLDKRMIVHCPHCEGVMRLNPFVVENNKKRIAIWWQKIRFKEYIIRKTSRLVVWRAGLIAKYFSGKN
jgi:WD40 repeat protein